MSTPQSERKLSSVFSWRRGPRAAQKEDAVAESDSDMDADTVEKRESLCTRLRTLCADFPGKEVDLLYNLARLRWDKLKQIFEAREVRAVKDLKQK